jgi:DNA-binding MarR family transcriptional regulator
MSPPNAANERAQQALQLLPRLSRWAARHVTAQAGAGMDVSLRQYAAMRAIREGVGSAGELARRWQVTPAVLTGVLDRLEARGLVRREPHPEDRRRQRLVLTEAGLALTRSMEKSLTGMLAARLATESPADLEALGRAFAVLERALEGLEGSSAAPRAEKTASGDERRRRKTTWQRTEQMRNRP